VFAIEAAKDKACQEFEEVAIVGRFKTPNPSPFSTSKSPRVDRQIYSIARRTYDLLYELFTEC